MKKFDIDFFKGLFNYLEVSPRLTGDKLLLKGWCHGSEQHCVWFNVEDMTVECAECGKMTLWQYVDAVYPIFIEGNRSVQDIYCTAWEAENDIETVIADVVGEGFKDDDSLRDKVRSCAAQLRFQYQMEMISYNTTRELKADTNFFFRGQPLVLKQGTKQITINEECAWEMDEVMTRNINRYFWCWNGGEYERNDFFNAAFEGHNKYKKKVVPDAETAENLLRLSGTQRQKLLYEVLATYYPLVEVSQADVDDLLDFCMSQKNQTAMDTALKLRWVDGLAKLVTFGLGIKMDGAASMTWCYEVDELPTKRKYSGVRTTWAAWGLRIRAKLEEVINDGLEYDDAWNAVRPLIYCQNKLRLTLNDADRMRLQGYVNSYLKNGTAEWPESLQGEIGDDYEFIVDFRTNFEIREKTGFTSEGRTAFNKERGCDQVMERFKEAFPNAKCGDIITTKELKAAGYTSPTAKKRLLNHEILDNFAYGKYRVLWVK